MSNEKGARTLGLRALALKAIYLVCTWEPRSSNGQYIWCSVDQPPPLPPPMVSGFGFKV